MKAYELGFKIPISQEMLSVKFISRIIHPPIRENFQMAQFAWLASYVSFAVSHHINLE